MNETIIRRETPADRAAVAQVNETAFGGPAEAVLVDALRSAGVVLLSVVAERDGGVAGHILFSRMAIDTPGGPVDAVALAPVAVVPRYQRQGIGGMLIRYGLEEMRAAGERIVIVV